MNVDNKGQSSSSNKNHPTSCQIIQPGGGGDGDHPVPRQAVSPTHAGDVGQSSSHADDMTMDSTSATPAGPSSAIDSGVDHTIASFGVGSVKDSGSSALVSSTLGQTGIVAFSPGPGVVAKTDLCADDQDIPGPGTSFYFICTILNSFNNILDMDMPSSRFELQGSSQTTGGIFRGRAHGNRLNKADFAEEEDSLVSIVGKVYLYVTLQDAAQWNLATMNRQVIKHEVTNSLVAVLQEIGDRHSPVRRKCHCLKEEIYSLLSRQ